MKYILVGGLCLINIAFSAFAENKASLIVATYIEPPYSYYVDDELTGIHVKIITLLTEKLNKQVQFVQCPFARCLSFLENGQADVIIGIRKTTERLQYLTYLDQPISTQTFPLQFYIRQDSDLNIANYSDLAKLRIGTLRAATYFDRFDRDQSLNKVEVVNYNQLIQMLLKDRIDTFLEREESVKPWIDHVDYKQKIKLADYLYNKSVDGYIAFSKKSTFINEIEQFSLMQNQLIKNGDIQAIRDNN